MNKEIYLNSIEETKIFAKFLAKHLAIGDVITFRGNLGSGKTSFIKYLINSLESKEIEVTSPSFNLLHIYNVNELELWHFDLYRVKNVIEIYELGIEEAFINGISLIEWPEIIDSILPKNKLEITLSFGEKEESRIVNLIAFDKWAKILENKL